MSSEMYSFFLNSNIFSFLFFVSRGRKTKDWKAQPFLVANLDSGQGFSFNPKGREKEALPFWPCFHWIRTSEYM